MKNYGNAKLDPNDTAAQILSPITAQLKSSNLTLSRLCDDLDDVIKTTKENPNAKLKGLDMGFKLNQAYPADRHEVTGKDGMSLFPALSDTDTALLSDIAIRAKKRPPESDGEGETGTD